MEEYTPTPPLCTLNELRNEDPLAYEIVMLLVRKTAHKMYVHTDLMRKLGLEKCEEAIMELLDTGYAKICESKIIEGEDSDDDILWVGFFNSASGEYDPLSSNIYGGNH